MVVWTSATAVSHCWIYDLLVTYCCLLHLPMKQPDGNLFEGIGLAQNVSKTTIPTTQAQPGKTVTTQNGLEMQILDATKAHKWLECLLSTLKAGNKEADLDLRLEATSKVFYANNCILCDQNVPRTLGGDFGGPVFFLVNAKCTNLNFKNLMSMAANFYVKSSGNQEALTGLNRGTPFCTSGINASRNKCN